MFRPPTKYSEYLQDVRKSIDYILKRVNATTVTKIVAGTNVTISPADGTGVVTINSTGGGGGGLPVGGTAGQILSKIDSVDYNAEWIDNYALWTSTLKHEVKAGQAINKGQAVYVSSADGTNMIVSKASNTTEVTSSKTMGLLEQNLAVNGKGFVITEGLLAGLDTSAANAAGDPVWLGADGNLLFGIANKPYAPLHMVSIGVVTRKNSSNGEIFVKVQNGFELDELHNVDARFPNNNDGIFYNSTTLLWEHKPVSDVYATPTLAQVTTAGNTTTNAITVGGLTSNGNVNVGSNFVGNGTMQYVHFTGGSGEFRFKNGSGGGWYYTWCQNGSTGLEERMRLSSNNNLLIGTTTDAGYKLDVNGTGRFSSSITGTVLKIDGTGAATGFEINSQLDNDLRPSYMVFSRGGTAKYIIGHSYGRSGFFISNGNDTVTYLNINSTGNVLVGTTTDSNAKFVVAGSITAASAIARGVYFNNTLVAAANNDVLVGLDINPTFTNGAFTGVQNYAVRIASTTSIVRIDSSVVGSFHGIEFSNSGNIDTEIKQRPSTGEFRISNGRFAGWGGFITLYTDTAERMRIGNNGNVLVGTTTDAGYKLDVNGTTRVNNTFTITKSGSNNYYNFEPSATGTAPFIQAFYQGVVDARLYFGNNLQLRYAGTTNLYGLDCGTINASGSIVLGGTSDQSIHLFGSTNNFVQFSDAGATNIGVIGTADATTYIQVRTGAATSMSTGTLSTVFFNSGNVGVNTTTDAGYKLDVNGTARISGNTLVSGNLTVSGSQNYFSALNGYIFFSRGAGTGINFSPANVINVASQSAIVIMDSIYGAVNYTGGTHTFNALAINTNINNGGSYNGIVRGIYYNPTLTSLTGTTHRAIETTSGDVIFNGGNVGIGTSSPSYPFHIASSAAANVFGTVQSTNASGTAAWVAFNDQSDNVVYRVFGSGASGTQLGVALSRSASLMANLGGSGKFLIGTYSGSDVAFGAGDQERMRIVNSTGNVLIGTTTDAGNKLEVSGTLNAVDFKVGGVPGWSGIINIPTIPPISITVNSGIITNVM